MIPIVIIQAPAYISAALVDPADDEVKRHKRQQCFSTIDIKSAKELCVRCHVKV